MSQLLKFYIFKIKRLKDDCIKFCMSNTCMVMQTNAWMINFLFEKFLSFFNRFVLGGISQSNFDIGWAWFTHNIKSHKQVQGLNMITLPCHTTHTFHTLYVYCFKPFKIAFKKEIDVDMARSKFKKLDKITFVRWVDKVLNQSLTKQNIKV